MLNKKVMIVSLGCDKNLVDTEKMLGILADEDVHLQMMKHRHR